MKILRFIALFLLVSMTFAQESATESQTEKEKKQKHEEHFFFVLFYLVGGGGWMVGQTRRLESSECQNVCAKCSQSFISSGSIT